MNTLNVTPASPQAPENGAVMPPSRDQEAQDINVLLGSYADILFVLLPFTVIGVFRIWQEGLQAFLLGYDLAAASAVLAGLALVKFILGLLSDARMSKYRERLVFLVAGTVFVVLVPSLMLAILVMLSNEVPRFILFVQPVLLIAAILAYSGAVTSTNHLLRSGRAMADTDPRNHA